MPVLQSLHINLHLEEEVDFLLRNLTELQMLNGLVVERDAIFSDESADEFKLPTNINSVCQEVIEEEKLASTDEITNQLRDLNTQTQLSKLQFQQRQQ
jgi:hypothetical protein